MAYTSNVKAFLSSAISSDSHLIQAYCGLVAIELTLKGEKMCSGHNVPNGIKRLGIAKGGARKIALDALANQLNNDLCSIVVLDRDGNISTARSAQFPDIRYTRCPGDGWQGSESSVKSLEALANRVGRIRNYLKAHFGYAL